MDFKIERYEEVSSTNDLVKKRIEAGAEEGSVISAASQSGGYGRRGNAWTSPIGGLYISLLLRPEVDVADLPTLSHACAIAVRRVIASCLSPDRAACVKIKWPNDVVYMDDACRGDSNLVGAESNNVRADAKTSSPAPFKKLCGISVERHRGAVCVGIGINVLRPEKKSLFEGNAQSGNRPSKNMPVYIQDLVSTDEIASTRTIEEKLLEEFAKVYSIWSDSLLKKLRDDYMDHFALSGSKARIDGSSDKPIECEVLGIDSHGNLEVIPLGSKELVKIAAGTVTLLQ